ncbi:MAG TPA: hypothetical protein VFR58_11965 [Flavisolibacter sp.]|nr:hypothetical protein [Flavisolibacter sp.]
MSSKPVSPAMHGIIDYIFSGVLMTAPGTLGLNSTAIRTYRILGSVFLGTNALSDTPAGLRPALSFKTHKKADAGFLAGLSVLSFAGFIRRGKKARGFHLAFLALAIAHYLLTDYDNE